MRVLLRRLWLDAKGDELPVVLVPTADLDALVARATKLAAERDDYEAQRDEYRQRADIAEDRVAALEADNARMREALESISRMAWPVGHRLRRGHAIVEPGGKWTIGGRNLNASGDGGCCGAEDFLRAIGAIN